MWTDLELCRLLVSQHPQAQDDHYSLPETRLHCDRMWIPFAGQTFPMRFLLTATISFMLLELVPGSIVADEMQSLMKLFIVFLACRSFGDWAEACRQLSS